MALSGKSRKEHILYLPSAVELLDAGLGQSNWRSKMDKLFFSIVAINCSVSIILNLFNIVELPYPEKIIVWSLFFISLGLLSKTKD